MNNTGVSVQSFELYRSTLFISINYFMHGRFFFSNFRILCSNLESFCWFPWATFYLQLKQWPIPTLCGRYELHTKTSRLNILLDLGIVMNQLKYSSPHMPSIPPSKLTRMKIKIKYIWKNSNKSYRNSKTAKNSTHIYKYIRKKSPL